MEPPRNGAQTVDRAISVLDLLARTADQLGVRDVARRLDLRPATAHRLLQALVRHGLVQQHPRTRAYGLGWKVVDYANALISNTEVATVATDLIKGLRDLTGETAAVQVRVGQDRVCVVEVESPHDLRRTMGVGRRIPLHAGASGRAIMAFLPAPELEHLIATSPPQATVNYDVLDLATIHALLDGTRRSGYARSEPKEERVGGIAAVSTPFFHLDGSVGGAVSISGPSGRWTREEMERFVAALLAVGGQLSRRLGFRGDLPWSDSPAPAGTDRVRQDGVPDVG